MKLDKVAFGIPVRLRAEMDLGDELRQIVREGIVAGNDMGIMVARIDEEIMLILKRRRLEMAEVYRWENG